MNKTTFIFSPEVQQGIAENRAIVALESSIISQGMPWPKNFETALELENIIRNEGVIPATIAIIDGKVHVGLDKNCCNYFQTQQKHLSFQDQI